MPRFQKCSFLRHFGPNYKKKCVGVSFRLIRAASKISASSLRSRQKFWWAMTHFTIFSLCWATTHFLAILLGHDTWEKKIVGSRHNFRYCKNALRPFTEVIYDQSLISFSLLWFPRLVHDVLSLAGRYEAGDGQLFSDVVEHVAKKKNEVL